MKGGHKPGIRYRHSFSTLPKRWISVTAPVWTALREYPAYLDRNEAAPIPDPGDRDVPISGEDPFIVLAGVKFGMH